MSSNRLTVRVSAELEARLRRRATLSRRSEFAIVCAALEAYLENDRQVSSAHELAQDLGIVG